jgi:uncharacterized protein (DUF1800 family)
VRRGAFEFNPARHDFGNKTLLGHAIDGKGFAEIENAVTLIVRSRPARTSSRAAGVVFRGR